MYWCCCSLRRKFRIVYKEIYPNREKFRKLEWIGKKISLVVWGGDRYSSHASIVKSLHPSVRYNFFLLKKFYERFWPYPEMGGVSLNSEFSVLYVCVYVNACMCVCNTIIRLLWFPCNRIQMKRCCKRQILSFKKTNRQLNPSP